jgi:predicted nucleic-acid-binding Zn-ribbon protein
VRTHGRRGRTVATTGAGLSRLVDIQNRQFRAVSCTRCGYTAFYRGQPPGVILDLFVG